MTLFARATNARPDTKSDTQFSIGTGVSPMRSNKNAECFCYEQWRALSRAHRQFAGVAGNCQSGSDVYGVTI